MKVLILGLGSIAKKHIAALRNLEEDFEIYALRSSEKAEQYDGVQNIWHWNEVPEDCDFIIISNPTSEHLNTILKCLELRVPLFVEKPPLHSLVGAQELLNKIRKYRAITYTAFNLRFHVVLQWVKRFIADKRVLEVSAYSGSYLPHWRPNRDYRLIYSAISDLGGGVHLDLIHELDYIIWLFGRPASSQSAHGRISELEIDSSDFAQYILLYDKMVANIRLNYFRPTPKRTLEVVMEGMAIEADLIGGKVINHNHEVMFEGEVVVQDSYNKQMRYFVDAIKAGSKPQNSLEESLKTLEYCLTNVTS